MLHFHFVIVLMCATRTVTCAGEKHAVTGLLMQQATYIPIYTYFALSAADI